MPAAVISGAVEGIVDEAVARRVVEHVGASLGSVYGRNGKQRLLRSLPGFNRAAQHTPWLVVVDLDQDADCAPDARSTWLPNASPYMCLRVAVREVESWLLADAERLSEYVGVPRSRVPQRPDLVMNPKELLVNLARRSRRKDVVADVVPRLRSGRQVGPGYTARLIDFAGTRWRPNVAAESSDSLRRCVERLRELVS